MITHPKGRLHHCAPKWVPAGETYHVRLRLAAGAQPPLTETKLGSVLLDSVANYHSRGRWRCWLFVVMPDHIHGLLAFPYEPGMSATVQQWKAYHTRCHGVSWQAGYFDHRVRSEREFAEKAHYLRRNPVAKGLCAQESDWRWVIDCNVLDRVPAPATEADGMPAAGGGPCSNPRAEGPARPPGSPA